MIEAMEKRIIRRKQREVIEKIKSFEKRSKSISLVRQNNYWGLCTAQINISKMGKVAKELLEYLEGICSYVDAGESGAWYHSYDICEISEDADDWELNFEFCIHYTK